MAKTVVGLYDSDEKARDVVNALVQAGCRRDDISLLARDEDRAGLSGTTTPTEKESHETKGAEGFTTGAGIGAVLGGLGGVLAGLGMLAIPGIGPVIAAGPIAAGLIGAAGGAVAGGLIGGLIGLGIPEEEAHVYAEGVRRGNTLVVVRTSDEEANSISQVMNRYNPIDIKTRAAEWRQEGWSGRYSETEAIPARGTRTSASIPVIEEELSVGKRQVETGGVRIHSHVTETPVTENVALRQERVNVERRPTDRVIGQDEAAAFQDRTVEMRESSEEPVVGKVAKVKEEVQLSKDTEIRQTKVDETVRKTDVDIEKLPGGTTTPPGQRPSR